MIPEKFGPDLTGAALRVLATLALLFAFVPGLLAGEARPLRGVALAIGNGAYSHLPALANPRGDAAAIAGLLSDLGFDAVARTDRRSAEIARDLDRFVEDAAGADVAVLYFAGHGIEAGGENFLLPVDADLAALDAAGERLVPLSAILQRLRETVPVTILLLDACRDNPFPAGVLLRRSPADPPLSVSAGGLAETRGGRPVATDARAAESLGVVIGFAAEPGSVAFDGPQGSHSPYASALLRHYAAMAGEEFGTVMRMVAEEVYLRTGGQQRPWVNESLRRLLFFGRSPEAVGGEEGEILAERRRLLVSIAALPDPERARVERIAGAGGVPLDAVFGMLEALGREIPSDPAELERLLREQAAELRTFLDRRNAIDRSDPELARLARLTDQAIDDGAIATARRLRQQVDARLETLSAMVDREEEAIRARRIEFAAEYARSAEVEALAFDFRGAADYYARAFEEVRRWDDRLAWEYRRGQLKALTSHGSFTGDNEALRSAIALGDEAAALADRMADREAWARTQADVAYALMTLGERVTDLSPLHEAVARFQDAIAAHRPTQLTGNWILLHGNLGNALMRLGEREAGSENLRRAMQVYETLIATDFSSTFPDLWSGIHSAYGSVLVRYGEKIGRVDEAEAAVKHMRLALDFASRENDWVRWGMIKNNLAVALLHAGTIGTDPERLREAIVHFREVLLLNEADRAPVDWAMSTISMGAAMARLAQMGADADLAAESVAVLRQALAVATREALPTFWMTAQLSLGGALGTIGASKREPSFYREALEAYASATEVATRDTNPAMWSQIRHSAAIVSFVLARTGETGFYAEALQAVDDALSVRDAESMPLPWAVSIATRGMILAEWGEVENDRDRVVEGREILETGRLRLEPLGYSDVQSVLAEQLARADAILAEFDE